MPTIEDKPLEELTPDEIVEAMVEPLQPAVNTLEENSEELKAMGIRDINELTNIDEANAMKEAMKNIQIQKTLQDYHRGSTDKKSPRVYLEHHIDFLTKVSTGKTKADIVNGMTVEHAIAALKTTAKMELPEAVVKKHLKILKKKYK
jgi:hypothetical protein